MITLYNYNKLLKNSNNNPLYFHLARFTYNNPLKKLSENGCR